MGHRRFTAKWLKLLAVTGLVGSVLVGCGEDGDPGPAGSSGAVIAPVAGSTALAITITGAKISSPPVVDFRVMNQNGESVVGLTDTDFRFNIAKLVPGTYGNSSAWQSYLNRVQNGGVVGTQERKASGSAWGKLVANGDGSYTYTFATDITSATANPCPAPCTDASGNRLDLSFQPNLTHRVGIQLNNTALPRANGTYDFVPAGGSVFQREIVRTGNCNECHGQLAAHGGGLRVETRLCVTCHNPGSWDGTPSNPQTIDFKVMVHKIHMGEHLPSVQAGGSYVVAGADFSDVVFPQDVRNCTKCHDGADPATPQGNNWQLQPSVEACGACHDNVNFTTGAGHAGGIKDNSTCLACHSSGGEVGPVAGSHVNENATPNNPSVPAGAVNFTYEIQSVTVTAGTQPVIKFRILNKDTGAAIVFNGTTSGTGGNVLSGFTGNPSFVIAYTMAQDGITAPTEYNNYRPGVTSAGQPQTVSLGNLTSTDPAWTYAPTTSYGTLSAPDAQGYYTATVTNASRGFPAGSSMRAVGLQGYFTQVSPAVARHTISVVKAVTATGERVRRAIIDPTKCGNCHEWLELHGGNRVIGVASDPAQPVVCVMCHNPNLSSSGRGADPATALARLTIGDTANGDPAGTQAAKLNADGYTAADPSTWPEATNNFKDMIHGIHGAEKRTEPYRFVRDRGTSGIYYYDWSHVRFPGILKNCEACHTTPMQGGGFDLAIPAGALASINITTDGNAGTTVTTDRSTVPNALDLVTTPITSACVMCHDAAPAKAHMTSLANGGYISTDRTTVNNAVASGAVEMCMTCHGPGRVAGIAEMHAK